MAHGPDTEELLKRVADCTDTLNVVGLEITSLPSLPSTLLKLFCSFTQIIELPALPSRLQTLVCCATQITKLSELPPRLQELSCHNTQITELPELPPTLYYVDCHNTQITELPELPPTLYCLEYSSTPLLLQREEEESISDYNLRWRVWREERDSKKRIQEKTRLLKEEIAMAVWHPRKVARLLEFGVDLEDM